MQSSRTGIGFESLAHDVVCLGEMCVLAGKTNGGGGVAGVPRHDLLGAQTRVVVWLGHPKAKSVRIDCTPLVGAVKLLA